MTDNMDSFDKFFQEQNAKDARNPLRKFLRHKSVAGKNGWYWFTNPWRIYKIPVSWWNDLRFFYSRGRRGYSVYDTWSLDSYLLKWLPDAIRDLRENSHGFPVTMFADDVDWTDPSQDQSDVAEARWTDILARVENGLILARRMSDTYDEAEARAIEDGFRESWSLLGEHFFDMWD